MPSILPAAILGSAAITGVAGGIGASQQAGAAKDAAGLQYQASQQAAAQQWAMFQQMQGNLAPYMMTGQNAMNNLSMLTGNSPMVSPEVAQWQQQLRAAQTALAGLNGGAATGGTGNPLMPGGGPLPGQSAPGAAIPGLTPGQQAALAYDPASEHSSGVGFDMLAGWGGGGDMLESLFGANNRSQLGDIWGAINSGLPWSSITDEDWKNAGFGPGGVKLGPDGKPVAAAPTQLGLDNATGGNTNQLNVPVGTTAGAVAPGAMPTDAAGLQQLITQLQGKINQANYSATPGNPLTAPLTRPFQPTMAELEATPGYQFTLNQGLKATQNAATAMGLGQSGPALAGAADYAAGLASQTYQQQFNNYWANNQNLYNMVSGLASLGQSSAAGVGNAGIQTAGAVGNLLTGGAAALGAGQVGAANAWAGGLNAIGGAGSNAALLLAMRNNGLFGSTPAASTTLPAVGAGNDASYMGASGYAYA